MPSYIFECFKEDGGCGKVFELVESMVAISTLRPFCPKCRKIKAVSRSFAKETPHIHEGYKTVGMLADRQTAKLSADEKAHMSKKQNEYKKKKPNIAPPPGMKWGKDIT